MRSAGPCRGGRGAGIEQLSGFRVLPAMLPAHNRRGRARNDKKGLR